MDSNSKLDQAIYTLKNIVGYLEEHSNIKANVTIFKFDHEFSKVLERTNVTEDNYKSIEKTISKIRPCGGTDIGKALQETTKYISELKTMYPTHKISHIFLTDGQVQQGWISICIQTHARTEGKGPRGRLKLDAKPGRS